MTVRKTIPFEFDNQKLAKLSEPITVTAHRLANGAKEPILLPIKPEESVPGKGWSADDVRQMDSFMADKWTGAGHYEYSAVGANGEVMKWKSQYPEAKHPPLHQGKPTITPAPQQQLQGVGMTQPAGPNWLGGFAPPPAIVQQQQPMMSPWNGGGGGWLNQVSPPPTAYGGNFHNHPFQQDSSQSHGVQMEREERLKLEARLDRERLENRYKEQLGSVGQEIAAMKTAFAAKPAESPEEVKLLRQQLEETRRQQSDDKLTRMIEESSRQNRETIQAMQTQTQQQIAALAAKPQGPDATMMMIVETMKAQSTSQTEAARASTDAQREIARLQADVQREQYKTQMGPRDIMDMMSRMSVGQEQLGSAYAKVWELMQQGLETVLSAQGPAPHPALELAGQAAQGGFDAFQRYIQMKEQESIAKAQAQVATAAHQADAAKAQASQAHAAHQRPGQTIESPALEGAVEEEPGEPEVEDGGEVEVVDDAPAPPTPEEIEATEREMFGQALGPIMQLRQAIAEGKVDVKGAAQDILQGIDQVATVGANVPAFELWASGDLARLIDVLIPDASTSFKEQLGAILFEVRAKMVESQQAC